MSRSRFLILFITLAAVLVACASPDNQELQVTGVWARPGLAGGNSAIFFVIDNSGTEDTLLSAVSDVAFAVELHKTSAQDGVMQMEHQMSVPVPTGKTEFKPGDLHVMLIGLKNDLKAGDSFEVTLNFKAVGRRTLAVTVK
jgi:copper(I)-binding protein